MGIEEQFDDYVKAWKKHCDPVNYSSNPNEYTSCEPYRRLVALGSEVLPFIRKAYAGSEEDAFFPMFGWASMVREIVGDTFQISEEIRGRIEAIRGYTITWLDDHLNRGDAL